MTASGRMACAGIAVLVLALSPGGCGSGGAGGADSRGPADRVASSDLDGFADGPGAADTGGHTDERGVGDAEVGADVLSEPAAQDILTTHVALDLEGLTGQATIVVRPAGGAESVWLEAEGLTILSVQVDGAEVTAEVAGGLLTVPVPDATTPHTIVVDYLFPARTLATFDGWMPEAGVSFIWPWFCSNLFPCNSSTDDGVTFTMEVTGIDAGLTAVYPKTTVTDAPSYMPAVALGDYVKLDLGTTTAGTVLSAWYLPGVGAEAAALEGTAHLPLVFDFLEQTYGPYAFGPEAGTVEVDWGDDSWGGSEHHPFFHVARFDFRNEEVQAHEAAHGWFGNGVRIACWEDFVLSEGTTTYMAAHALESVGGPDLWPYYVEFLEAICTGFDVNTVALPDSCGEIDFLSDDLWSLVPYIKGACFYEGVADLIGAELLDEVIRDFYLAHVNRPARMREMLDSIKARVDAEQRDKVDMLVEEWLLSVECPADYATRCSIHQP
jgi:aminopeptidase N